MEPNQMVNELRNLIHAQNHDLAWFSASSKFLKVEDLAEQPDWFLHKWNPIWGTVSVADSEVGKMLVWLRHDGGAMAGDTSETPAHIKAVRFALLAELGIALVAAGKLSFCKVGWPLNWRQARIKLNGTDLPNVIEADALFGTCKTHVKKDGKFVVSETNKQELLTTVLKGHVEINIEQKQQTLF